MTLALTKDLAKYKVEPDVDVTVDVDNHKRTNVVIRCSDGTDVLVSIMTCVYDEEDKDHLSIDVCGFRDDLDEEGATDLGIFTLHNGRREGEIAGRLGVVKAYRNRIKKEE